jgi:hypothetical protein
MEREEHRIMIPTSHAESQHPRRKDSQIDRIDRPFLSKPPSIPDKKTSESRPKRFHPHGIQRLSVAIINHAVLDLLEKGRHSSGAERWLLSPEFDRIHNVLG